MPHRQALLGLVGRTASWPQRLGAWSAASTIPVTVSYCQSAEHLQARLDAQPTPRVVLLDGDLAFVDRDLLGDIAAAGGLVVVIDGDRRRRPWQSLGAAGELPSGFNQQQLMAVVRELEPSPQQAAAQPPASIDGDRPPARLVAVTGPGGTGASLSAIALAQGLAAQRRRVLLADCCLHAEQAMLHNARGTSPGLVDIIELHAERTPARRELRQLTVGVVERGYHLLPGLPRARHWARIRPGSLRPVLRSLRSAFDVVVADVDADVEGEAEGGSIEVEERHVLARVVVADADAVVVVGQPTMKGAYALVRTMVELLDFGVRPERLLAVVNQADTDRTLRAELGRAVRHLLDGLAGGDAVGPVLFAPPADVELCLQEGDALPDPFASLLSVAVATVLDRVVDRGQRGEGAPVPVAAGSIGHWEDQA